MWHSQDLSPPRLFQSLFLGPWQFNSLLTFPKGLVPYKVPGVKKTSDFSTAAVSAGRQWALPLGFCEEHLHPHRHHSTEHPLGVKRMNGFDVAKVSRVSFPCTFFWNGWRTGLLWKEEVTRNKWSRFLERAWGWSSEIAWQASWVETGPRSVFRSF